MKSIQVGKNNSSLIKTLTMYEEAIKTLQQMLVDGEAALQKSKQEHQEWQEEHGHHCLIIPFHSKGL